MTTPSPRWDVRTDTGDLVTNLDTLATVLHVDRDLAAKALLDSPTRPSAPAGLVHEAQAQMEGKQFPPKPGGGTPPPISTGSFVSWPGGKGRVDLVVTNGKVPGIEDEVEGSKKSPAVRIVVWEKDGDTYKASRKKVGAMAATVKRIPPLTFGKKAAPGTSGTNRLVELLADHSQQVAFKGLGEPAAVSGAAVLAVYERGLVAWPGSVRVAMSREEWGQARVKAFLDVAAGTEPGDYTRDLDLLPEAHPLNPESKAIASITPTGEEGVDYVIIDQAELDARVNALLSRPDPDN
jgi:hypothetical protein